MSSITMKPEISELIEEMCDDYCFYRTIARDEETLHQHCDECPLTRMRIAMEEEE